MLIAVLGVGIGSAASQFAVIALLYRPSLPYANADRLVHVEGSVIGFGGGVVDVPTGWVTAGPFDAAGLYAVGGANVGSSDWTERLPAAVVSPGFFETLVPQLSMGRGITRDQQRSRESVVVVSHAFRLQRLGADSAVLGESILVNGTRFRIVGVMPARFSFPRGVDLWLPLFTDKQVAGQVLEPRIVARLRPGWSTLQARESLAAILSRNRPADAERQPPVIHSLQEHILGAIRPSGELLATLCTLLLLTAAFTAGHLALVDKLSGLHRLSIQTALGADRRALVTETFTEVAMVSITAGLIAVATLFACLGPIQRYITTFVIADAFGGFGMRLALGAVAASVIATVVFAFFPVAAVFTIRPSEGLRVGANVSVNRLWQRVRHGLVVSEVALATALVFSALILWQGVARLSARDVGFHPDGLVTARLSLPMSRYPTTLAGEIADDLARRAAQHENVLSAGVTTSLPHTLMDVPEIAVRNGSRDASDSQSYFIVCSADYFDAMGIPIIAGRTFGPADTKGGVSVAIISRRLAVEMFGSPPDGLDRLIDVPWGVGGRAREIRVVGIVGDVQLSADRDLPQVYVPPLQWSVVGPLTIAIRTKPKTAPMDVVPTVVALVREFDPGIPVFDVRTGEDLVRHELAAHRVAQRLNWLLAVMAVGLASCGVFAAVADISVSRRQEMIIRLMLGEAHAAIMTRVTAAAATTTVLGIVIGTAAGIGLGQVVISLFPNVVFSPTIAASLSAVLVLAASGVAALSAARDVRRLQPAMTLTAE